MTTAVSIIGPKFYGWNSNTGEPLAFGKVYFYKSGTNVPKATYTSEDAITENPNPVVLNGAGYADIYLIGSYKVVIKDANDVEVWTSDPVTDASSLLEEWIHERAAVQVDATRFKIEGNVTDLYIVDRAVKLDDATYLYGLITDVQYLSGETFVTVALDSTLTGDLSRAWLSVTRADSLPQIRVKTSTGYQKLDKSLDSRVVFQHSLAHAQALSGVSDGQYFNIQDTTFQREGSEYKSSGVVNVKAFGAIGDGTTDDSDAIQAAINHLTAQGGGLVCVVPGEYRITKPLLVNDALVSFLGAGSSASEIRADATDALRIVASGFADKERIFISKLGFTSTTNGVHKALEYQGKPGSSLGAQLTVELCSFRGVSNGTAWRNPIILNDAKFSEILSNFFRGNTSDFTKTVATVLINNSTDVKILNNYIYWSDTGIDITGFSEGIYVSGSHFVPVNRGVRHTGTGNLVWVVYNHIAANVSAITFGSSGVNSVNHSQAFGNLIFKRGESTSNFVAIQSFSNKNTIIGNEVLIPGGGSVGGTQNGIVVYSNSEYTRVIGNQIANMDSGIIIQSGAKNTILVGNTFLNVSDQIVDQGTNTTSGLYFSGELVRLSGNKSIPNETLTAISWDSAVRNSQGFWDAGTSTRLKIPAGVRRVRVRCSVLWQTNSTGERLVEIRKNGGLNHIGLASQRSQAIAGSQVQVSTAVMDVNPSDYFEVFVRHSSGGALLVENAGLTWCEIETIS